MTGSEQGETMGKTEAGDLLSRAARGRDRIEFLYSPAWSRPAAGGTAPLWLVMALWNALLFKRLQKNHHALHEHSTRFDGIVIGRSDIAALNPLFYNRLRIDPHALREKITGERRPPFDGP
jgi:hypothetical protein